jgi:hypothetical protein
VSGKVCSHRGCTRPAHHGVGWGIGTGLTQWFCTVHFAGALVRLAGLLPASRSAA